MEEENVILQLCNDDKRCSRCGRLLPLHCFHRSRRSKDTYQSWCIECKHDYHLERKALMELKRTEALGRTVADIMESVPTMRKSELTIFRGIFTSVLKMIENRQTR